MWIACNNNKAREIIMSTLNKAHVKFALGLADKKYCKCKHPERSHFHPEICFNCSKKPIDQFTIDLDFLRGVPIEHIEAYNDALYEILDKDGHLPKETGIARTAMKVVSAITFAIHNAKIAQRLQAIYDSQGGGK